MMFERSTYNDDKCTVRQEKDIILLKTSSLRELISKILNGI